MKTIKNLTADELRKSILQLAIQGKLVKQNPDDEPASELVKKIYEEKKKLIAEGKIKKDKNESYIFKGDDNCYYEKIGKNEPVKLEDLPFDIPDNWTWIRLKSLANIYNGNSINEDEKKKKYTNVIGRDFIATKDVGFDRTIAYNNGVNIPYELDTFKIAPANKILMCIEGGSAGRKIAITDREVCFGNKLACFDSIIVDDFYLFNIFQSTEFTSIFKSSLTGIIGGVSINTLKEFIIPLPPLAEQQRIVDKINSFEPLIQEYDKYEKQLTELESTFAEKLKKSILQFAIEGKLVKQDPNDEPASVLLERIKAEKEKLIKEGKIKRDKNESYSYQGDDKNYYENIPNSWSISSLSNISSLITKGTTPRGGNVAYLDNGIGFLRAENVLGFDKISNTELKYISEETHLNYLKRSILFEDDILITIAGTLGRTGLVRKCDLPLNTNQAISIVRIINKDLIKLRYLTYVLNAPSIQNSLTEQKKITAIPNLTLEIIGDCIIPIAPIKQQNKIVNKLDYLFSLL